VLRTRTFPRGTHSDTSNTSQYLPPHNGEPLFDAGKQQRGMQPRPDESIKHEAGHCWKRLVGCWLVGWFVIELSTGLRDCWKKLFIPQTGFLSVLSGATPLSLVCWLLSRLLDERPASSTNDTYQGTTLRRLGNIRWRQKSSVTCSALRPARAISEENRLSPADAPLGDHYIGVFVKSWQLLGAPAFRILNRTSP
jgi:hypothetical protein